MHQHARLLCSAGREGERPNPVSLSFLIMRHLQSLSPNYETPPSLQSLSPQGLQAPKVSGLMSADTEKWEGLLLHYPDGQFAYQLV